MMRRKVSALIVVIPTLLWSASAIGAESGPTDSTEPAGTAAEAETSEPGAARNRSGGNRATVGGRGRAGRTRQRRRDHDRLPLQPGIGSDRPRDLRGDPRAGRVGPASTCSSATATATTPPALNCMQHVQGSGRPGHLNFQHDIASGAEHLRGRARGRSDLRHRHPAAAVPDGVHGRRQLLRRRASPVRCSVSTSPTTSTASTTRGCRSSNRDRSAQRGSDGRLPRRLRRELRRGPRPAPGRLRRLDRGRPDRRWPTS